jgi:hypothetical protein
VGRSTRSIRKWPRWRIGPGRLSKKNPGFYARHLYRAACKVAPDAFATPEEVAQALKNAEKGDLCNAQFLVQTILDDLELQEQEIKKPARILLVLDGRHCPDRGTIGGSGGLLVRFT